jgi:hypothetical protein
MPLFCCSVEKIIFIVGSQFVLRETIAASIIFRVDTMFAKRALVILALSASVSVSASAFNTGVFVKNALVATKPQAALRKPVPSK